MNALAVTVISFGTGEELGSFFLAGACPSSPIAPALTPHSPLAPA